MCCSATGYIFAPPAHGSSFEGLTGPEFYNCNNPCKHSLILYAAALIPKPMLMPIRPMSIDGWWYCGTGNQPADQSILHTDRAFPGHWIPLLLALWLLNPETMPNWEMSLLALSFPSPTVPATGRGREDLQRRDCAWEIPHRPNQACGSPQIIRAASLLVSWAFAATWLRGLGGGLRFPQACDIRAIATTCQLHA